MTNPRAWRGSVLVLLAGCAYALAAPQLEWRSDDILESLLPHYKYVFGPPYEKPADPKAPDPGSNYGSVQLQISDAPPQVVDRVLRRDAKITGRIADAPGEAQSGQVWIEDNYGRIISQADLKSPAFEFALSGARSLGTGLYLKGELKAGDKTVWTGAQTIRMAPADGDPWGDFILGVYNMGTKPGTGDLFREMGLGHRAVQTTGDPGIAVQNDLRFHASNILYSLLGLYHRDFKRWREIQAAEQAEHGPIQLARHRCLSDPKEEKFIRDILTAAALRFKPFQPLHYSIGDEIGIGDMASPHDLCGSEWCMARYREWLKSRYATIEKLNAQWETGYKDWSDVEMFSTWQALDRAKTGNFSPWADRLAFMDVVLYGAVAKGVAAVRAVDPKAMCNISGVQQPSCWGFDHWLLARTVNCATPYEIGEGPDVLMSFYNDGKDGKIHMPGFGNDTEGLWRSFVRGYAIAQQWDDSGGNPYSNMIDIDGRKLAPLGEKTKEFADWVHGGPGRMRNRADRARDPVAILYSQASLRGNWILEMTMRPDIPDGGAGWITRGSWSVRQKERSFRVRVSWVQWMHDVGIWPKFVDVSQVDDGCLTANGTKVLVLPRAVALSDRTAAAIRAFAEGGGTVIADTWPGLMDEHCRMREKGVLDDFFGVRRGDYRQIDVSRLAPGAKGMELDGLNLPFVAFEKSLKTAGGKAAGVAGGVDVAVSRKIVRGRAVYLNFDMESYFLHRLSPGMTTDARRFLLKALSEAGVAPVFTVREPGTNMPPFHAAGHDLCLYRSGRGFLVGVMANPTVMHSDVGGVETRYQEIKDNVFLGARPAVLTIPGALWTYDLTDGRALGNVRAAEFTSKPLTGRFYACWPFEIKDLTATAEVTPERRLQVAGRLITSAPVTDEKLAVALRVYRQDGSEQRAYRRTIDCNGDAFALTLPLGLNEHGEWSVVIREPCTGKTVKMAVRLP